MERPYRISWGSSGNALVLLIGANVVTYLLLIFIKAFYFFTTKDNVAATTIDSFYNEVFNYFVLPSSFGGFLHQPWSLLSYMITHDDGFSLFSNILWLAAFGFILQGLSGNKKIIPLYLYGGILGGIFFIVMNRVLPGNLRHVDYLIGSTPAIVAIAAGATTLTPNYRIFPMLGGGIPLWILFAIFMVITVGTGADAGVAYVSTILLSALIGFFIIYQLKKGNDYGEWMYRSVYKVDDLFNPDKKHAEVKVKNEIFYKTTRNPFETKEHITQERIDELLDKINYKGYDSLTKAEKDFLRRAGKEN